MNFCPSQRLLFLGVGLVPILPAGISGRGGKLGPQKSLGASPKDPSLEICLDQGTAAWDRTLVRKREPLRKAPEAVEGERTTRYLMRQVVHLERCGKGSPQKVFEVNQLPQDEGISYEVAPVLAFSLEGPG